ncbi:hypothetical protein [Methanothermococcus okinawensis]|uniref:Uncharacterized protein n=1 Tax=Methanothermococcus okinawensis (strain DSM 14208 / JCM 11175 / IH1) TaxID=647113 RepID=F8AMB6_METOI|nr:hypothetical protein [Methanothermococcus okinawensis]AEH06806.1 hypothetical protein Metok_0829 [Methanothermococcus okinawensis IH1]
MHYSIIKPIVDEEKLLIDRGSLKTKRKFAFLLEKGDIILVNKTLEVNEEVEVLVDYTYTEKSKRPKESIKIYKIKELIKE